MYRLLLTMALMLCTIAATTPALAVTWYIKADGTGDAPTIQVGLDSCAVGDTLLVAEGTFAENLTWPATGNIVLMSESGAEVTVIDGGRLGSVISILSAVDEMTRIEEFTIRNGYADNGGGIFCQTDASPTITGNTITGNEATLGGGGIGCGGSSPTIITNTIKGNLAYAGGGIGCSESSPTITDNVITGNDAAGGGGILWADNSSPTVAGNTIDGNHAYSGGGIFVDNFCGGTITDNSIEDNTADHSGGGITSEGAAPTISGNTINGNTAQNKGGGIHFNNLDFSTVIDNEIIGNTSGGGAGIRCEDGSGPTISFCTISENIGHGLYCIAGGLPVTHNNYILDNTGYGVMNADPSVTIDTRWNYWGDPSGPGGVGPGTGEEVSVYVDYVPWWPHVVGAESPALPASLALHQNRPNPFNPQTTISFSLTTAERAVIRVFDLTGQRVNVLANREFTAGSHSLNWNGRDSHGRAMPSGTYIVRLESDSSVEARKVMLMK